MFRSVLTTINEKVSNLVTASPRTQASSSTSSEEGTGRVASEHFSQSTPPPSPPLTQRKVSPQKEKVDTKFFNAIDKVISGEEDESLIEKLLKAGSNPNAKDAKGNAALHLLAKSQSNWGDKFKLDEVTQVLINHEAKINLPNAKGDTPLHLAIRSKRDKEDIEFLLNNKADPNLQNDKGDTPLHCNAAQNHFDLFDHDKITRLLLARGAKKTIKNKEGELPIHKAYKRKGNRVTNLLQVNESGFKTTDSAGKTPLHLAAKDSGRNIKEFKEILEQSENISATDNLGNTPMHYAASEGFLEAVKLLRKKGASVDIPNREGNTPLFLVVFSLLDESYSEITSQAKLEGVGEIITVLHSANKGSNRSVRFNVSFCEDLYYNRLRRIIDYLLDQGANPYCRNREERSIIEECFRLGKMRLTFRTSYFETLRQSLK